MQIPGEFHERRRGQRNRSQTEDQFGENNRQTEAKNDPFEDHSSGKSSALGEINHGELSSPSSSRCADKPALTITCPSHIHFCPPPTQISHIPCTKWTVESVNFKVPPIPTPPHLRTGYSHVTERMQQIKICDDPFNYTSEAQ